MLKFFLINDFSKNPLDLLVVEFQILDIIYGDALCATLDHNSTNNIL